MKSSMRALEWNTGQENQTLPKTVVKRFENIKEIVQTDEQGEKAQEQDLDLSVCTRV